MRRELYRAVAPELTRRTDETEWSIHESSFTDYIDDIRQADDQNLVLAQLEKLRHKREGFIIVDLMGSVEAMRCLRRPPYYMNNLHAAVVCGYENRQAEIQYEDQKGGIDLIPGNLAGKAVWDDLLYWLSGAKADCILERGYNGLHYIPHTPEYYRFALQSLWHMLSPRGGLMVLQTPSLRYLKNLGIGMEKWLSALNSAGIHFRFAPHYRSVTPGIGKYGMLLVRKDDEISLPDITGVTKHSFYVADFLAGFSVKV